MTEPPTGPDPAGSGRPPRRRRTRAARNRARIGTNADTAGAAGTTGRDEAPPAPPPAAGGSKAGRTQAKRPAAQSAQAAQSAPSAQSGDRREAPAGAKAARKQRADRGDRGLRDLIGGGPSQVGVVRAMRARDVDRPTAEELAEAERDLVIVRRHWQPKADS